MSNLRRRSCRTALFVALTAVVPMVGAAHADVVTLASLRDNTLYEEPAGLLSNGAGEFMFVGRTSGGSIRRALLEFDLSSIPLDATINSVTLALHMSMSGGGSTNVSLHRALANWGEGSSNAPGGEGAGAPATLGDATWLHTFFDTALWSTPGGDFNSLASATAMVGGVNSYTWSSAQMIADIEQWMAVPSNNFGWLMLGDESATATTKRFGTRENLTVAFRPALTIDYTPVPAPSALTVIVVGFVAFSRRRR